MPKQKLGTGNKRAVLQRPKTSYTSPRVIQQRQRQAAALDFRLQGHAYHRIAKELHCHPSTAHDLVVKGLHNMVPRETAQHVLAMELARLDALLEKYQPLALRGAGDKGAAELCLKISNQRCRLAGLYPDRHGGVNVLIGNTTGEPNAEDVGIRVVFEKSTWREDEAGLWHEGKLVEPAKALPPPAPEPEPKPKPEPPFKSANVIDFCKC